MTNKVTFKGEMFGVEIRDRGENDTHKVVTLLGEDDEFWHRITTFSSYWIDDLIRQLEITKAHLEKHSHKGKHGYYGLRKDIEE